MDELKNLLPLLLASRNTPITNRVGDNEYSEEDIADMDDSELDLDTLELLKKYGLR